MKATEATESVQEVCRILGEIPGSDSDSQGGIYSRLGIALSPLLAYLQEHHFPSEKKRVEERLAFLTIIGFDVWASHPDKLQAFITRFSEYLYVLSNAICAAETANNAMPKLKAGRKRGAKPRKLTQEEKDVLALSKQGLKPKHIDARRRDPPGTARRTLHRIRNLVSFQKERIVTL